MYQQHNPYSGYSPHPVGFLMDSFLSMKIMAIQFKLARNGYNKYKQIEYNRGKIRSKSWLTGWLVGWMNGWVDGWMVRWMDGWMDGWLDG